MCGIIAITGVPRAAELAVVGAHELQHRARTYAGAVTCDGENFYRFAGKGLARQVFGSETLGRLHGDDAIVHVRYPTLDDDPRFDNTHPILGIYGKKQFALAHNGNLTNVEELKTFLHPSTRMTTSLDTEYIVRLIEQRETGNIEADIAHVLSLLKGSFSLAILFPQFLIAARDKRGNRPLSIGRLEAGYCVASETCAFPAMGARHRMDVEAGTMIVLTGSGMTTWRFAQPQKKQCVFELLYNSLPVSRVFGVGVDKFREQVGAELERLFPVMGEADGIVTPVPDSGNSFARGYARCGKSGDFNQVILRNHYVGRTFNAASQGLRDEEVTRKFIWNAEEIQGKRIVVVDDSIVRGTTGPKIIDMLWWLGAKEVHMRIGTPPIVQLCRYGIYMDEDETDLLAAKYSLPEIAALFRATSLEFFPLEALKALLPDPENYCFTCMGEPYW